MGSSRRSNSTRTGKARSVGSSPSRRRKPVPSPPAESSRPEPGEVLDQFLEVRSIFACVARCLDEIADPHELDAPEPCAPKDVVVVVRLGLGKLDEARAVLDGAPP